MVWSLLQYRKGLEKRTAQPPDSEKGQKTQPDDVEMREERHNTLLLGEQGEREVCGLLGRALFFRTR